MSQSEALQYFSDLCHFEFALFRLACFCIKDSFYFSCISNFLVSSFIKSTGLDEVTGVLIQSTKFNYLQLGEELAN